MGELAVRQDYALSLEEMTGQVRKIQEVMSGLMIESDIDKGIDGHYGKIPGTQKKTLLKAGAEMLCMVFRLAPDFEAVETWDGEHLTVRSRCVLVHIPTGQSWGTGLGSCSTKESKYAWRKAERKCPRCGVSAIIKGQQKYGGGWVCWKKKDGCDAKFKDGDAAIESQEAGRVPNPDIADQYNTVLKMANKRAHVAATLVVTAASDMFTQDIEDLPEFNREPIDVTPPKPEPAPEPEKPRAETKPDPALDLLKNKPKRSRWECAPRLLAAVKDRAKELGGGDREKVTKWGSQIGDAIEAKYGPLPEIPDGDKLEGAIEMAVDFHG
jgi:hypothetical protein